MELVLPMNFLEIEQEEMVYLDGGYAWWQYALVYGAIAVAGVGQQLLWHMGKYGLQHQ